MKAAKCESKGCRKIAKAGKFCYSCVKKRYAEAHPVKYAYQTLRQNAKRRKKEFTITLEEFTAFCYETDILHGRGITSTSWHIDRIDNSKGYVAGNLQVLTNAENVRKENKRRKLVAFDFHLQQGFIIEVKEINDLDTPF